MADAPKTKDPASWHGTDPVLEEDDILRLLRAPVTVQNLEYLQAGAAQGMIAMYDRKGTRENFALHASDCLALYSSIGKLYMLRSMADLFADGRLSKETIDKGLNDLAELIKAQAMSVSATIEKVKMCPTSADAIH